jgi:hypothetical protein
MGPLGSATIHDLSLPIGDGLCHMAFVDSRVLVRSGAAVEVPDSFERLLAMGTGGAAGYHRGYHIGKITTLRALLGRARAFG